MLQQVARFALSPIERKQPVSLRGSRQETPGQVFPVLSSKACKTAGSSAGAEALGAQRHCSTGVTDGEITAPGGGHF